MPQTLLAILALITVSNLSFRWKQEAIRSQQGAVSSELRTLARGVATEVLERSAYLPFDAVAAPATPDDCTPESAFGDGSGGGLPFAAAADLDDLHDMEPLKVTRRVVSPETGEAVELDLFVTATVAYVDDDSGDSLEATGGRKTFYKRLTVTVSSPHLSFPVRVPRVYSYEV